jgi:3-dehydroquinate synthase
MKSLIVDLGSRSYEINISTGIIPSLGAELKTHLNRDRIWVVSDSKVLNLYRKDLEASFKKVEIELNLLELPSGERTKSFQFLERTINWFLETGIERKDLIVAFGGGVIGDLVGFAAAITLRGIDYIQIPTTLLAQVDSSVGGKTGINSQFGKNLIGNFNQPKAVIIDVSTLNTLCDRQLKSGYSEILKYSLLGDKNFFDWLELKGMGILARNELLLNQAIEKSCLIKAEIVKEDEKEDGKRALLNLGHTFGHALEAVTGYSGALLHGEGVSIGCMLAFEVSAEMGFTSHEESSRVKYHLRKMGLRSELREISTSLPSTDNIIQEMFKDKKVNNGVINFIMVRNIGDAFITNAIDFSVVSSVIDASR